jgi:hypothetical protein
LKIYWCEENKIRKKNNVLTETVFVGGDALTLHIE